MTLVRFTQRQDAIVAANQLTKDTEERHRAVRASSGFWLLTNLVKGTVVTSDGRPAAGCLLTKAEMADVAEVERDLGVAETLHKIKKAKRQRVQRGRKVEYVEQKTPLEQRLDQTAVDEAIALIARQRKEELDSAIGSYLREHLKVQINLSEYTEFGPTNHLKTTVRLFL